MRACHLAGDTLNGSPDPVTSRVIERARIMHAAKRTGDIEVMRRTAIELHTTFPDTPRAEETP